MSKTYRNAGRGKRDLAQTVKSYTLTNFFLVFGPVVVLRKCRRSFASVTIHGVPRRIRTEKNFLNRPFGRRDSLDPRWPAGFHGHHVDAATVRSRSEKGARTAAAAVRTRVYRSHPSPSKTLLVGKGSEPRPVCRGHHNYRAPP